MHTLHHFISFDSTLFPFTQRWYCFMRIPLQSMFKCLLCLCGNQVFVQSTFNIVTGIEFCWLLESDVEARFDHRSGSSNTNCRFFYSSCFKITSSINQWNFLQGFHFVWPSCSGTDLGKGGELSRAGHYHGPALPLELHGQLGEMRFPKCFVLFV